MKVKKMKAKNKRLSAGLQKQAKRNIHVKGEWKAVELDPSLFSEEGMEGLVCFEELTNYRLVGSKKAAAKAAKELKKEKKKAKKRKASEGEEVDVESKEREETTEPSKKKAKKKNTKRNTKESVQPDAISAVVSQEDVTAGEEAREDETAKEDSLKDLKSISSDPDAQSKPAKKRNKKKQKQQIEKDAVPEEQSKQESPSEIQALEKESSTKEKVTKPPKKQQKNWTNVALSCCNDKNADVSAWKDLFVPSPVLKALSSLGFGSPTPIQALALPSAIRDRMDILGAAETGEIKYLFGLMSHNNLFSYFHK